MGILRARVNALTALCSTMVTARCPGSGLGTLRARRHLMFAVSRPGSGLGTLRARMHLMMAVSRPGSGAGTLRARMHLMMAVRRSGSSLGTLRARMHLMLAVRRSGSGLGTLRARMHLMLAVSRRGSGAGTLRARMHAQTLPCATTASYISITGAVVGRMNAFALLLTLTSAASCTSSAVAARTLPPAPQPDACHEQPQGQHWPHVTPRQTHGLLQTRAEKSIVAVACVATCVSANQSAEQLHGSATSGCIISLSGVCDVARSSFSR